MKNITFVVYGDTADEIEEQAIKKLAAFSGTDTQWTLRYDIEPAVMFVDGDIASWKAEVSGWLKGSGDRPVGS